MADSQEFTAEEEERLLHLIVRARFILENKNMDEMARKKRIIVWHKICRMFNVPNQKYRSMAVLRQEYENMKENGIDKLNFGQNGRQLIDADDLVYVDEIDIKLYDAIEDQVSYHRSPVRREPNHSNLKLSQVFSGNETVVNAPSVSERPNRQAGENSPALQTVLFTRKRRNESNTNENVPQKRFCNECSLSGENLTNTLKNSLIRQQIDHGKIEHEWKMANLKLDLKIKQAQYDNVINRNQLL